MILLILVCPLPGSAADDLPAAPVDADILLRQGLIHRGDGRPAQVGDCAIRGDRIVAVGQFPIGKVGQDLDCRGLVVCPGFIDLHNHSDEALLQAPTRAVSNYVTQGCTTIVTGNCGFGPVDVAAYYASLDAHGIGVNVAHLVPQGSLRQQVMGDELRAPSDRELRAMRQVCHQAMLDGAWGMSSGLIYVPSSYADLDELASLAHCIGTHGGIYASHIRNENVELLDAVEEALEIGRRGTLPVHISHFKSSGQNSWGLVRVAAQAIQQARASGQSVTADQYPYAASSTSLEATLIPPWARAGGREAMLARFDDPIDGRRIREAIGQKLRELDDGQRLQLARYAAEPTWTGQRISAVAEASGESVLETAMQILRNGGASVVNHSIDEQDVRFVMTMPWVATASDGSAQVPSAAVPHPRSYGTFPRKIGYYALHENALGLAEAIRSSTGLPADILGLQDRGYLRPGLFADVAVFDPATFCDRATFRDPHQYASGLRLVLVNGQAAVHGGTPTGDLAGRTLRHRSQLSLPAAVESAVDELFGPWNRPQVPGCVVGIVRGGQLIYERGFGSANLDQQVPLTPHSKFYLASVSKQFVATAIGLLVLDQQIRLEDDIRTYVPELPEYDQSITIEHLIHHTSGLRDYLSLMEMAGLPFGDQHSRAELLDLIARQRELEFPPGQRYAYSNTGYFLLAEIVQRVSQKSLRQFTQERIFEPLGMQHTFFHDDRHAVVEGRVTSYCQSTQGAKIAYLANWDQVGSGGLLSCLRDLAVWICNFDELRVGGPDLAKLLLQRGKLNDGREIPYAFGLMHGEWRGLATVGHSGSFMGFRTALLRVPSERFAVVVLANEQNLNAEELARQILDICLAEPMHKALLPYAGTYRSEELLTEMTISVKGSDLMFTGGEQNVPLLPTPHTGTYRWGERSVVFERQGGQITACRVGGGEGLVGVRFVRTGDAG